MHSDNKIRNIFSMKQLINFKENSHQLVTPGQYPDESVEYNLADGDGELTTCSI